MILDRVRATIRDHALFAPGARVVIAVSGGSDSVALAEIASRLHAAGELRIAGVAHFNHQLRDTAARDEASCRELADRLGWPMLADRGDVAARAAREHRSREDAARASRYEFFDRARSHFGADCVALGHTRDDQAETFLLRLVRGAGARGLASMYPRNGWIVRPLLACRRAELRAYLAALAVPFLDDESNDDVTIARNRVRAELLPLLEARFNPNIVETLAAEAELARDEWAWMSQAAAALDATTPRDDEVSLDIARLAAAHPALRRLVVWTAMNEAAGGRSISFDHVAAVLRLMNDEGGAFDAPGQRVHRDGPRLVLRKRPPGVRGRWSPTNLFCYSLSIPGEVLLPEAGCAVSAEPVDAATLDARAVVGSGAPDTVALVRRDLCSGPLAVRNRRPGDRFQPAPLTRAKKLQDFFADKNVARHRRDRVPLVVDETGRIVWVAGYGTDAAFRVTDPVQGVLILRLRQLGGPV